MSAASGWSPTRRDDDGPRSKLVHMGELERPEARSRTDAAIADAAIALDFHGGRCVCWSNGLLLHHSGKFHGKAFRDAGGIFTEVGGTFTYAGEFNTKTMKAEGHGLLKMSRGGPAWSVELADGMADGCVLFRNPGGYIGYFQYKRGKAVLNAREYPGRRTEFDGRPCNADHAEFGILKAAALAVEVRPAPHPQTRARPNHNSRPPCRAGEDAGGREPNRGARPHSPPRQAGAPPDRQE